MLTKRSHLTGNGRAAVRFRLFFRVRECSGLFRYTRMACARFGSGAERADHLASPPPPTWHSGVGAGIVMYVVL